MTSKQRTITAEFKREAVQLAKSSGKSAAQVARDLGISDSALYRWMRELHDHEQEAFPGKGHQTAQEEELKRLRRENAVLREERDILKKALAIFTPSPR